MKNTKVATIYFEDIIATKDWNSFTIWNFSDKNLYIHQKFSQTCKGTETPDEKKNNEKVDKRKGTGRITMSKN